MGNYHNVPVIFLFSKLGYSHQSFGNIKILASSLQHHIILQHHQVMHCISQHPHHHNHVALLTLMREWILHHHRAILTSQPLLGPARTITSTTSCPTHPRAFRGLPLNLNLESGYSKSYKQSSKTSSKICLEIKFGGTIDSTANDFFFRFGGRYAACARVSMPDIKQVRDPVRDSLQSTPYQVRTLNTTVQY